MDGYWFCFAGKWHILLYISVCIGQGWATNNLQLQVGMFLDFQDVQLFHGHGDRIGYHGRVHCHKGCRCDLVGKNTGVALPVCEVRVE